VSGPLAGVCERCWKHPAQTVSVFNTDLLCDGCWRRECKHPKHGEAVAAVQAAMNRGDYLFAGIGLPDDLAGEPA